MIIDTPALVAILVRQPGSDPLLEALVGSRRRSIGAPTLVETSIVLTEFGASRLADLATFIREAEIDVIPFDETQASAAQDAYRRFGRGSGSRARLNLGDCFSYATSIVHGRPLLFVGDDFPHTDVISALAA